MKLQLRSTGTLSTRLLLRLPLHSVNFHHAFPPQSRRSTIFPRSRRFPPPPEFARFHPLPRPNFRPKFRSQRAGSTVYPAQSESSPDSAFALPASFLPESMASLRVLPAPLPHPSPLSRAHSQRTLRHPERLHSPVQPESSPR
jgi:hypothetical protein